MLKNSHIETVTIPKAEYEALKQTILDLRAQVKLLQEEICLLKNGRKSNTSSSPPSQDIGRSNQKSLREPSGRKTGGQQGHEGTNLKMKEKPDEIIEYRPDFCKQCGETLNSGEAQLPSRKQEVVLPPIAAHYVEYQSYCCTCGACGAITTSELPPALQGNIQYGANVNAWVAYLSVRQYISYERIAELMKDCFNMPISEGTIDNMLKNLTQNAQTVYQTIQQRVGQSPVVGSDETGIKINGKRGWLWAFQTPVLTFLTVSFSRGFETITNVFKNGFPISVYVTDCWAAQLKTSAQAHQICISHLLRELNNFMDALSCEWSVQMKQLLQSALSLKSQLQPNDYINENENVKLLEK